MSFMPKLLDKYRGSEQYLVDQTKKKYGVLVDELAVVVVDSLSLSLPPAPPPSRSASPDANDLD